MVTKLFPAATRLIAGLLLAGSLWAIPPAMAQNTTAPAAPPAASDKGASAVPDQQAGAHAPAQATGPETKTVPAPAAEATGWGNWGDGIWLAVAFVIIVLIAVFFYRRTSERP